jgi:3-deoxy-D-manno-octulosonic-acid transferase
MRSLFFFAYNFFLWPLMRVAFWAAARLNPKIKQGLTERVGAPWLQFPAQTQPVWFHCASGEFEYAKPVITELKRRDPDMKIIVTYFSPTMAQAIRRFPGVDFASPVPWDTARALNRFLTHHKPRALLIARTDAWPNLVRETARQDIPTLLFSATLTTDSGRMRSFGREISRAIFPLLTDVYCVSKSDQKNFESIGANAKVSGDTRYDQVQARLANPKPLRNEIFIGTKSDLPILVAGSTWPEDEEILCKVASALKSRLRVILVPHEPTPSHLEELESHLRRNHLSFTRYSLAARWDEDVLIVDEVGILAELYLKGQFAFVGGSFRKTVHSVMEPLAAGCATFLGPKHLNNREAVEFQSVTLDEGITAVQSVDSPADFIQALEDLLNKPVATRALLSSSIKTEISKRTGGSILIADWVRSHARY